MRPNSTELLTTFHSWRALAPLVLGLALACALASAGQGAPAGLVAIGVLGAAAVAAADRRSAAGAWARAFPGIPFHRLPRLPGTIGRATELAAICVEVREVRARLSRAREAGGMDAERLDRLERELLGTVTLAAGLAVEAEQLDRVLAAGAGNAALARRRQRSDAALATLLGSVRRAGTTALRASAIVPLRADDGLASIAALDRDLVHRLDSLDELEDLRCTPR